MAILENRGLKPNPRESFGNRGKNGFSKSQEGGKGEETEPDQRQSKEEASSSDRRTPKLDKPSPCFSIDQAGACISRK